ncbi:hypothetical protein OBBRIDRAFT_837130 [Obba rivulosa]|uniref:Uncharacterized protein n=1 Tax=Obba rivulosa TaxID=1052685 RepID=A0A8E2AN55_9APHY|nr:hypothetical protein OBBRIDRAFT_837130 [Obba rivulosa]
MGTASSSCASVAEPPSDATYSPSLSGYDSSTSDDSQVAPDLDLTTAHFSADAGTEIDPITLADMLIGLEMNHTVDFDGCARPRHTRHDRRRQPTPYDYVQCGMGVRVHSQNADDKSGFVEQDKQMTHDLERFEDDPNVASDIHDSEAGNDTLNGDLSSGNPLSLASVQPAEADFTSPGSEHAVNADRIYSSVLQRCVDGLDKYRSPLSAHMDELTRRFNVFDPKEREEMRKAMLEFTPPDGQTWTPEQWSAAIAQEVEYFRTLIGEAASRTLESSERAMNVIQETSRLPKDGHHFHGEPNAQRASVPCPVHGMPVIDPDYKPVPRSKKKAKREQALEVSRFECDTKWSFPLPGLPVPIVGTLDKTGDNAASVKLAELQVESQEPSKPVNVLPKGVPVIPPDSPLTPPEAPPDPLALLTEAPWSVVEVLLLLHIVAHFPPSVFGWERITDAYNYALMEHSLQEWFSATGAQVDEEDAWMLKAEQRYIALQFQRMRSDRMREAPKAKPVAQTIPPTYAEVLRRRLQPRQPQPTTPPQSRPHPFCLRVAHRPPLTFPSDLACFYEAIVEFRIQQPLAEENAQLAELLRVLYMEFKPRFPLRSPWECWHRWCVPYISVSDDEQREVERSEESAILRGLKNRVLKRAEVREVQRLAPCAASSHTPSSSVASPPAASSSVALSPMSSSPSPSVTPSPVTPPGQYQGHIHSCLGNILEPSATPPPGTYPDVPGVKRAASAYDPHDSLVTFTLATLLDAEPLRAEHGAVRSKRIVSEASRLLRGVQVPLTHKAGNRRDRARGRKAGTKHANVPVGTLGSRERPGIRAWFENAAVNRTTLRHVFGEGSDGPWRKMVAGDSSELKRDGARADDVQEKPTQDNGGSLWLPAHLKTMQAPPLPDWSQARFGVKASSGPK